jgi:serpin B
MTYAGARAQTAEEMATVLHFAHDHAPLHPAFAALNWEIAGGGKPRGYELYTANALWGQQGFDFLPDYLQLTKRYYGAGFREVDFRNATETARRTINDWVMKQTHNNIQELLSPGILDSYTRLVLTNAIYFKGDWASQFKKQSTSNGEFLVTKEQKVQVPMMHQTTDFNYLVADGFQILEMPYRGDALSMVVFLPEKVDGLPAFEQTLAADKLEDWLSKLHKQEVDVILPKFQVTAEFQLKDTLSALGMPSAFTVERADFSGMDGRKDLYLTAVVHKAFVDVNEEGTEAAAATGVAVGAKSARRTEIFRADHPFMFLIYDQRSGSVLFMGRVVDPK